MLSIILQLGGSIFLSYNAITKTTESKLLEIQLTVPNSMEIDNDAAFQKQKEYFLNIFGFVLLSIGYLLALFNWDLNVVNIFSMLFTTTLFGFILYVIYLLIEWSAKRTVQHLIKKSKEPLKEKIYLHFGPLGSGYNDKTDNLKER